VERKKGQRYSNEFRREALEQMKSCENILGLSRELGIEIDFFRRALQKVGARRRQGRISGDKASTTK